MNLTQRIDTVDLYYLEHQRKVSLKYLASTFLKCDIQQETHDSIEDARTALLLYRKYQELAKNGTLTESVKGLYTQGHSTHWKVSQN